MKLTLEAAIAIAHEHNACQDSLLKIEELGSWEAVIAHTALLNWVSWWHDNVAPLPAYETYNLAMQPAHETYNLATKAAYDAYDLAIKAAHEAYNLAHRASYEAYALAHQAVYETYNLATKAARDAYALAFEDALSRLRSSLLAYLRD